MEPKSETAPVAPESGKGKTPELSKAKVAQILGGKITVLQKVKGKEGERDSVKPVERSLRAEDVLSFKVEGKMLTAVTADGQKRVAEIG